MSTGLHFILAWSLLWIMLLGVCLWAISRGGQAERVGALLILTAALLSAGGDLFAYAHGLREHPSFLVGRLAADAFLALGFLALSIRYASLWLGGAMLLQAGQFSLQAAYFVLNRPHDGLYSTVNNINFFLILVCLGLGTWSEIRRQRASACDSSHAVGITT